MESIEIRFELTRELGLVKAIILSYINSVYTTNQEGVEINGRALAKTFPISKSTIYKAIKELEEQDNLVIRLIDGSFILSDTFYKRFPYYNKYLYVWKIRK